MANHPNRSSYTEAEIAEHLQIMLAIFGGRRVLRDDVLLGTVVDVVSVIPDEPYRLVVEGADGRRQRVKITKSISFDPPLPIT